MTKPALLIAAVCVFAAPAFAQTMPIVAAENFYGDVAGQVAGANASVSSILSNPDQDPHLFEASPSVARQLSGAAIVVYSGTDYDPWMAKLLSVSRTPNRTVIVVANLVHKKAGDNPHIWYDPPTMPAYAKALPGAYIAWLDQVYPMFSKGALKPEAVIGHRRFDQSPVPRADRVPSHRGRE